MLFAEVKRCWPGELVLEESPKGDSDSICLAERAVNVVEGLVRTYKIPLERRIGCQIDDHCNAMTWIVEWAALLHRRYKTGSDGLTTYERLKGKRPSRAVVEFGEQVLFKTVRASNEILPNTAPRFEEGTVVGIREVSDEVLVHAGGVVHRARTIKRRPKEERWSVDAIMAISTTALTWSQGQHRRARRC